MPRGRKRSTLGELESKLAQLDGARLKIVAALKARVDAITGSAARGGKAMMRNVERSVEAAPPKRGMSAAGRAKLRAAAKRRWAQAKKAGKTRLG